MLSGGGSASEALQSLQRRRPCRPFSRGAIRLFHLDVKRVLCAVAGHGEFQGRGLQVLVFRMDGGAAGLAFLGQRRRRDQHLVFSFHGAVVFSVRAQSKRAVGLDFSPRTDLLVHGLEDHKTGGDRLAVFVSNFAADRKKSLAAAPAGTEQDEKDRGYSVPRALSACARDHADTEHHPSPGTPLYRPFKGGMRGGGWHQKSGIGLPSLRWANSARIAPLVDVETDRTVPSAKAN